MTWSHDELAHDLAETRRGCGEIVCEKLSLASWSSGGIMDVASIRPSQTEPRPRCWEIKVSRSDLLSDLRSEKWRKKYLPSVDQLYFATPKGLVDPREIPDPAGLVWRGPKGWYTRKAPVPERAEPGAGTYWKKPDPYELLLAMMVNLHTEPRRNPTRGDRIDSIRDEMDRIEHGRGPLWWRGHKELGKRVASLVEAWDDQQRTLRRQQAEALSSGLDAESGGV